MSTPGGRVRAGVSNGTPWVSVAGSEVSAEEIDSALLAADLTGLAPAARRDLLLRAVRAMRAPLPVTQHLDGLDFPEAVEL